MTMARNDRAHVRAKILHFVQAYFATRIRFVRKKEIRRISPAEMVIQTVCELILV